MYDSWLIMREITVCGVGTENIPGWVAKKVRSQKYDSYGLELISPIFESDSNNGYDEIAQLLKVVDGMEKVDKTPRKAPRLTGAFITNQCGFHVHVQVCLNFSMECLLFRVGSSIV